VIALGLLIFLSVTAIAAYIYLRFFRGRLPKSIGRLYLEMALIVLLCVLAFFGGGYSSIIGYRLSGGPPLSLSPPLG